jgi:MSHA biogenesis protein MshJ
VSPTALYRQASQRFDALSIRERVLIMATAAAVTWLLWALVIDAPLRDAVAKRHAEVASVAAQRAVLDDAVSRLDGAVVGEADHAVAPPRATHVRRMAAVDANLDAHLTRFVDAREMPAVLGDLLGRHRGVKLAKLANERPQPLRLSGGAEVPGVYRHALHLELVGGYAELSAYLAAIERTPWRFRWQSLRFEVIEHPSARLQLIVETLSSDNHPLGV